MANDTHTNTPDPLVFHGWRLSRLFKYPEHVPDVLKRFGPLPPSAMREIIQALDVISLDWWAARQAKPSQKFAEAGPKLKRMEHYLRKAQSEWNGLKPNHPAFARLAVKMASPKDRKRDADLLVASINLGLTAARLLPIAQKMSDPKEYSAAQRLPHQKSAERAFLWEPLFRLMQKYQVAPGRLGSVSGAIRSLHLALGIDPQEGAVRKMLHDMRPAARPKN